MRITRLAALPIAGAALVASLTSCTNWGVNAYQWAPSARNAVVALGNTFDIKPFTYPGHDPDAAHASDFMLPDGGRNGEGSYWVQRGWALAHFAQANHTKFDVHYIVFRQHIWNIERANEGWRLMANRGNWTQNHMDHVHISYY